MKILSLLLSLIPSVSSLVPPEVYTTNHKIYSQYESLGKYKHWFEPNLFSLIEQSKQYEEVNEIQHDVKVKLGNSVVKYISGVLPHVDNIGHNILHANNVFINDILNNPVLDHETQKKIILFSIKLAQYGDDMGSHLLETYYNIVDYSL